MIGVTDVAVTLADRQSLQLLVDCAHLFDFVATGAERTAKVGFRTSPQGLREGSPSMEK